MRRILAALTLCALLVAPLVALGQNSPFPKTVTTTLQNAASSSVNGTTMDVTQLAVTTIQVSGTFTATVSFQGSTDGTNFAALTCYTLDSSTSATSASAAGIWRCNTGGLQLLRTPVTWSSGTSVTVIANGSSSAGPIRDVTSASGAVTGPLRGTQTTAPTCAGVNGGATPAVTTIQNCQIANTDGTVSGTDSFMRGLIGYVGYPSSGGKSTMRVTFAGTWAAAPSCLASIDNSAGGMFYGYYLYAVSPTTTTVDLKLTAGSGGAGGGSATGSDASWPPGTKFSLLCGGVQ